MNKCNYGVKTDSQILDYVLDCDSKCIKFIVPDYEKGAEKIVELLTKDNSYISYVSFDIAKAFNLGENKEFVRICLKGNYFEFKPLTLSKQEAINQALELRPDLKSNEMLAHVQEESLKVIKKQYMPEITGDLTWGYTKTDSNYSSPLQMGASIGLGSINPYGIHYQIKEGESMLDIAYHNVNIAKTDIFWEVQTNYVNMRQLERKIPLMNSKVKATLENFELADGRYSVGLNNYVELQDALANYNNAQLNFVEAVFNYNVARETLLKSMGVK